MRTINLRELYPWYTEDAFIEVSDEVAAFLEEDKCNVTRSVSKMTEIEGWGGKRWDKPKKAGKSRDCGGGKF